MRSGRAIATEMRYRIAARDHATVTGKTQVASKARVDALTPAPLRYPSNHQR